jgi:peroxiredoxin
LTSKALKAGKAKPVSRRKNSPSALSKKVAAAVGVAILALGAIYWTNTQTEVQSTGKFKFQVGDPGPGEMAPPIRLSSNVLGTFDLAALRGKTVLLYFQEGLMCQPCWDQINDIEKNLDRFRALGIDMMVSITTDPADLVQKKSFDDALRTPVLSDPDLAVSKTYNTNKYGMMGDSRNGHTFILVGPDGRIQWRADYGGAPDYTMYLPSADLLADIRRGLGKGES